MQQALTKSLAQLLENQNVQLSGSAADVAYGNAAHLLDAANFVKEAWDAISAETIANSFAKTKIMNLTPVPVENSENEWINEIISMFAKVSIEIDVNDAINFERIDEENTEEYVEEILKDVDNVLEDVKEIPDESHLSDGSDLENNECLVKFEGFDNLCEMAINIENQFSLIFCIINIDPSFSPFFMRT